MSTLSVIGAGNIGSHLLPLVARMPEVDRVRIVDPDRYEVKNLSGQDIVAREVGKPKAVVQARRLLAIRRELKVEPLVARVEDVPLGHLKSDVLVACLDSRRARQRVNEIAWRLGVPWIDAGVRPEDMVVRVSVYAPSLEAPCMECAWSNRDYELLEQAYPCSGPAGAPSTNAPSALGALAAALQALECRRLLEGDLSMAGKELVMDARTHRLYCTAVPRNPACRFDHATWRIEGAVSAELTLGEVLELGPLGVPGKYFTRRVACTTCERSRQALLLADGAGFVKVRCWRCGGRLQAPGFDLVERLDGNLPERVLHRPLSAVGIRWGEILAAGDRYLEVC